MLAFFAVPPSLLPVQKMCIRNVYDYALFEFSRFSRQNSFMQNHGVITAFTPRGNAQLPKKVAVSP